MVVLPSCPDHRLRGYVGELVGSRDHELRIRFLIRVANEVDEAWIAARHLRAITK